MRSPPQLTLYGDALSSTHNTAASSDNLSSFPGEEPPIKEKYDWVKANQPIMRRKYGALLRGETPAELVAFHPSKLPDLSALVPMTDPDAVGTYIVIGQV